MYQGGAVFAAMEFMDAGSLAKQLKSCHTPSEEVLPCLPSCASLANNRRSTGAPGSLTALDFTSGRPFQQCVPFSILIRWVLKWYHDDMEVVSILKWYPREKNGELGY